jgi:hypothetical protein
MGGKYEAVTGHMAKYLTARRKEEEEATNV